MPFVPDSDTIKIGDYIIHKMLPRFRMRVEAVRDCEIDPAVFGGRPHKCYQVTDPDGYVDWVCSADVKKAEVPPVPRDM